MYGIVTYAKSFLRFHGFNEVRDVGDFVVEMVVVHVVAEQQITNALLIHLSRLGQMPECLVDADFEAVLARLFRQVEKLRSETDAIVHLTQQQRESCSTKTRFVAKIPFPCSV